jgi:3-methylfumaryl-CoA hydratase
MSKAATGDAAQGPGTEWQDWVGRKDTVSEMVAPDRVAALAATLDLDVAPGPGAALPPGWHWIFFNPFVPRRALGPDGHPRRGGFLPPIPLPRRMWAGGRLSYPGRVTVGAQATRESTISRIEAKSGRAGQLVFVTVLHRIFCDGMDAVVEEQDIVYREPAAPGSAAPALMQAPDGAQWSKTVEPDTTLLFRYSALTSNGHRIHYDQHYARHEENYPDLVVHGPLTATLLQNLAVKIRPSSTLVSFEFRGMHPLFVNAPFTLEAKIPDQEPDRLELWARGPAGELAMRASARFSR